MDKKQLTSMQNSIKPSNTPASNNVSTVGVSVVEKKIQFTFKDFRVEAIKAGEPFIFNNHFRDDVELRKYLAILLKDSLPMLSNMVVSSIRSDSKLRFHEIKDTALTRLIKVLGHYCFSQSRIDDVTYGNKVYQIQPPGWPKRARLILEVSDNLFSPLFFDLNHHLYPNEVKIKENGSADYEHCITKKPVKYNNKKPSRTK